jgi:RNA ligase
MDFKFPHTPHLAWLGPGTPRADKVLTPGEVEDFLSLPVIVEEKVDGANLGIFFVDDRMPRVKNRGTVLGPGSHPQFEAFWPWLAARQEQLHEALGTRLALFGEWCFAVHSLKYDALPDYFLAFDVYDLEEGKFWSVLRRNELAGRLGVVPAAVVAEGVFTLAELRRLTVALPSKFGAGAAEGVYLRQDQGGWLRNRAKMVRPEFVQAIEEHWSSRAMEKNKVTRDV